MFEISNGDSNLRGCDWETNRRATPAERRAMAESVQELAGRLHLDNVDVVTSMSGLEGEKARAKGFYDKRTGKITIVIPNNRNVADAVQTLLHEAVAHYGLRKMFGEHFDTFLDNVFSNAEDDVRRRIVGLASKNGRDIRKATEEYLAGLAERTEFENAHKTGWWQKIKDFFAEMLDKIGLPGFNGPALSDNELRYILWRSYENLRGGGANNGAFAEAADIVKQQELGVGEFSADMHGNMEEANRQFNEELQQQVDGRLPAGHIYKLGRPGGILLSAGFPDMLIEISATRLAEKSRQENHPFEMSAVKDLVKALNNPVAVFRYGNNAKNVIVGIEYGGKQFLVGVHFNQTRGSNEVSSIRGIFPKDNAEWLNWIAQGGKRII